MDSLSCASSLSIYRCGFYTLPSLPLASFYSETANSLETSFIVFLQIPCVMWILKLKTLCASIYVHGYECVESYAHVYVEAGFKFKYCFSSGASHCFFLSLFEKGWWTTMGLKHIEDSGKRGMEPKNHFKPPWGIWWFFIQEIKSFHSCNMNIFFLTITYFLISFLYYFESCPGPTTRYLLRVRTNIIA